MFWEMGFLPENHVFRVLRPPRKKPTSDPRPPAFPGALVAFAFEESGVGCTQPWVAGTVSQRWTGRRLDGDWEMQGSTHL